MNVALNLKESLNIENTLEEYSHIDEIIYGAVKELYSEEPGFYYSVILQGSQPLILEEIAFKLDKLLGHYKKGAVVYSDKTKSVIVKEPYIPLKLEIKPADDLEKLNNEIIKYRKELKNVLYILLDEDKRLRGREENYVIDIDWALKVTDKQMLRLS